MNAANIDLNSQVNLNKNLDLIAFTINLKPEFIDPHPFHNEIVFYLPHIAKVLSIKHNNLYHMIVVDKLGNTFKSQYNKDAHIPLLNAFGSLFEETII